MTLVREKRRQSRVDLTIRAPPHDFSFFHTLPPNKHHIYSKTQFAKCITQLWILYSHTNPEIDRTICKHSEGALIIRSTAKSCRVNRVRSLARGALMAVYQEMSRNWNSLSFTLCYMLTRLIFWTSDEH